MARLPMTIIRRSAITKRTRRRPAPKQTVVQRFAVHRSAVQQAKWSAGNRSIAERSITERSTAEWPVANSVVNPLACRSSACPPADPVPAPQADVAPAQPMSVAPVRDVTWVDPQVLGADQLQVHEAQSEDMPPEARQALEDFVASGCDYPLWPLQP
ncbi:hypothetical protein N7512_010195 [Penicillium capsulatum]|nr:hypothetical protein N7512_010195 [Penicillium capsulatum]